MAKIINGSSLALALANYLCTNAYLNDTAQDVLIMVGNWIDEAQEITVPKWIPVTERLPDHEDAVLCFIKNGQQDILQFDKFENLWVGMQWKYKRHAVTHWKPLPEAPKEGNK